MLAETEEVSDSEVSTSNLDTTSKHGIDLDTMEVGSPPRDSNSTTSMLDTSDDGVTKLDLKDYVEVESVSKSSPKKMKPNYYISYKVKLRTVDTIENTLLNE